MVEDAALIGTPDEDLSAHVDEVQHCCVLNVDGPAHLELREIVMGSLRGSAFRESESSSSTYFVIWQTKPMAYWQRIGCAATSMYLLTEAEGSQE